MLNALKCMSDFDMNEGEIFSSVGAYTDTLNGSERNILFFSNPNIKLKL